MKSPRQTTVCRADGTPDVRTVYRWLETQDDFRQRYARARKQVADFLAAQILETTDDGTQRLHSDGEGSHHRACSRGHPGYSAGKARVLSGHSAEHGPGGSDPI
jgi:hypothetical protein